jgi:hypothetical protein
MKTLRAHRPLRVFALLAPLAAACGSGAAGGAPDAGELTTARDAASPTLVDAASTTPDDALASRDALAPDAADATVPDASRTGADGEPCAAEAECASAGQTVAPGFTSCDRAWPGGYCRSFCVAPAAPAAGAPLDAGDCPRGSACLPTYRATGVGLCLRACTADSDCRVAEGYYCRRDFAGVSTSTGVCAPPHCKSRGCAGGDCSC